MIQRTIIVIALPERFAGLLFKMVGLIWVRLMSGFDNAQDCAVRVHCRVNFSVLCVFAFALLFEGVVVWKHLTDHAESPTQLVSALSIRTTVPDSKYRQDSMKVAPYTPRTGCLQAKYSAPVIGGKDEGI